MNQIKAVIFDMDGVLIDAKDWHYEALNRALAIFGMSISRYDHLVTYDGLPTREKLKMLSRDRGFPEELHSFINDLKQQYTMELIFSRCKPIFCHQFALSKLKNEGYKLAVCSNSIKQTIQMMMEKAGLMEYLDFFLSNQDVVHAKPDPEIYNVAISRLNLQPSECLILEDNEYGIAAAKASGAHVMTIKTVYDVNYPAIKSQIQKAEAQQ